MLKTIYVICILLLSSCSLMPGMQNLETASMHRVKIPHSIKPCPVLILITPTLLLDQHVTTYYYKVAPSDVLTITVWEHPEFNILQIPAGSTAILPNVQGAAGQSGYLVNSKGYIYFPLAGHIKVAGMTVDKIRTILASRLKKYVQNPQVNVRVADFRGQKIYVMGEVRKPGIVPMNDQRLTIADAMALAGGIDQYHADPKHIYVIRGTIEQPVIFWLNAKTPDKMLLAENFSLQPKDILYISSAPAARWNRMLSQLVPSFEAMWYTQAMTVA